MKLVCHRRFDKIAAVLFQSRDVFRFLGVESLRCEDSNPVQTQPNFLKVQSCLDAGAIARPGVLLNWGAWLWAETGVRWACLSFQKIRKSIQVLAA
jgi:hypothetical protein